MLPRLGLAPGAVEKTGKLLIANFEVLLRLNGWELGVVLWRLAIIY